LIIKSADRTEDDYPNTTTSSHPNDNVIKTSAKAQVWGAVCKNIISDRFSTKSAISAHT